MKPFATIIITVSFCVSSIEYEEKNEFDFFKC